MAEIKINQKEKIIEIASSNKNKIESTAVISISINIILIATSIVGGLSSISTSILSLAASALSQVKFLLSDNRLRQDNNELKGTIDGLVELLKHQGYTIKFDGKPYSKETGFYSSGSFFAKSGIKISLSLVLGLATIAMVIAANLDLKNKAQINLDKYCGDAEQYMNDIIDLYCDLIPQIMINTCTSLYCISSYALGSFTAVFSSLTEYIMRNNLERTQKTLHDSYRALSELYAKLIDEDKKAKLNAEHIPYSISKKETLDENSATKLRMN